MSEIAKPVAQPTSWTKSLWEGCAQGKLMILRCMRCSKNHAPTRRICDCSSMDMEWRQSKGEGVIATFTVVHRAPDPAFKADLPYVIAIIELDEGVRLMSNLVEFDVQSLFIGQRVRCLFDVVVQESDEQKALGVPKFTLV